MILCSNWRPEIWKNAGNQLSVTRNQFLFFSQRHMDSMRGPYSSGVFSMLFPFSFDRRVWLHERIKDEMWMGPWFYAPVDRKSGYRGGEKVKWASNMARLLYIWRCPNCGYLNHWKLFKINPTKSPIVHIWGLILYWWRGIKIYGNVWKPAWQFLPGMPVLLRNKATCAIYIPVHVVLWAEK